MSDIQIPQRNPQYVAPIAPPTDLIQALYNRPKQGEIAADAVNKAVNSIYDRYIQQQQLKAQAFGEGGPFLYNLLYGKSQPIAATPASQQGAPANQPPSGPILASQQGTSAPAPAAGQSPLSQDQYHAVASHLGVQPDFEGYQKAVGGLTGQMQQSADLYGPSKFGQANQQMLGGQLAGLKTGMEAQNAPLTYAKTAGEVAMQPMEAALKNQQLVNAKAEIPMKIGQGSAQQADEFAKSNIKTGSGMDAFNQLEKAWNEVPSSQKGPYVGVLSKRADDMASGKFPQAAAYNKLREGLVGAIVAGIDPQGRQGPSLLAQIEKAVPTLQTAEPARQKLMDGLKAQLQSQQQRNYEGYNQAAQSFGGSVPKPKEMQGQVQRYAQTATNPQTGHQIGSNDGKTWFDAQTGKPIQ